jgi:hypothetical protein
LAKPLTLRWRQIIGWIIDNALILQLVLSPLAMLPAVAIGAGPEGAIAFALCTHDADGGKLPADGKDAACQLCLICCSASPLPDPSCVPVATSDLVPIKWARTAAAVPRSRRLARERSRGPPHAA